MIVVRISGGLGNQMFQYAAGRKVAQRVGADLKLDISACERNWLHSYSLDHFNITASPLTARELRQLQCQEGRLAGLDRIDEVPGEFNQGLENGTDNVYLRGYWQSERYFADIGETIRNEFTLRHAPTEKGAALAEDIAGKEAVGIHVRRGDFVTVKATNETWGTCSLDYYRRCVEWFASRLKAPHFFVFSNDPRWATSELRLRYPTEYVMHNYGRRHTRLENSQIARAVLRVCKRLFVDRAHEDLWLMSLCKHFIIANSTFSWWGAWLCRYPSKIVCCPRNWFANQERLHEGERMRDRRIYENLIPNSWIRI